MSAFMVGNAKLVNMLLNYTLIFSTHIYYYCKAC